MGKGITPIIAVLILTGIVLSGALVAQQFVLDRQEDIKNHLEEALRNNLEVERVYCNGKKLSFLLNNTGGYHIDEAGVDVYIYHGAEANYSMSRRGLTFEGGFQEPHSSGYFNVTINGLFLSDQVYSVELAGTDEQASLRKSCRGGRRWWDINWDYRRQVVVENQDSSGITDGIASVELNTSSLIDEGRMNPDCSDLRVVEKEEVVDYSIDSCNSPSSTIKFRNSVSGYGRAFDTYIYYGNLRAEDESVSITDTTSSDLVTDLRYEESR
ncbi:MAG: hypothetical protein MUP58_00125 [Candidatus Nanohaloarchaeota archaeon QJJ-9]|nr:hypothetical protein [Candidatus Nanohaloarchaeota archaeon QJJ-9]